MCHRGPLRSVRPRRRPLDMASERRQVLWYVRYGLCSSQQVKPGSGWQEQQGAAAAEVAAGRGCGTARLRQRPKAGSGVGGKWQKKVGGAARWRQRHVGWGWGCGCVCHRGPLRSVRPQRRSLDMASERRQVLWYVCYGLCSSQQVKPGSGWQEQQGAAAAEVAAGRGCGTARLRQRPKAGSGVGGKWQKKVGGAARWRQRHVGWGWGCGCVCHRGPLRSVRPRRRPLDMASERRQVLWYVRYGLCSSQQVKPGSGWQESKARLRQRWRRGAAAAQRGCGRDRRPAVA